MKLGYLIEVNGTVWECISGGTNIAVFQKQVKLQKKVPSITVNNKNKKEDIYYLEFITVNDLCPIIKYLKEENIKYNNYSLYYIWTNYCNIRAIDIASTLNVQKSNISRDIRYAKKNINKVDELARTLGYWKYKQLSE